MKSKSLKEWITEITTWARRPRVTQGENAYGFRHVVDGTGLTTPKMVGFNALRSDTNAQVTFGIGAEGTNHGVWSNTLNKWLIHADANGNVLVNNVNVNSTPIKLVRYGWTVSPASSAGTRIVPSASPTNSSNPGDKPSGYTFKSWVIFTTNGWAGAIYPSNPIGETTDIWTATVKGATSGVSIFGVALYVRSDLV